LTIKELPEIWPNVILFSVPYLQVVGTIKFTEEFRGRLAKKTSMPRLLRNTDSTYS
jgi:hypothetical protein